MRRTVVVVILAAALLTACGGGSPAAKPAAAVTTTTTASAAPTPTPSPTPTVLTMAQARAAYLALVKPGNAELDVMNKAIKHDSSAYKPIQASERRYAKDNWRLATRLRATLWPKTAQPAVNKMVDAVVAEQSTLDRMAEDKGATAFISDFNKWNESSTPANRVRFALGLPSAK